MSVPAGKRNLSKVQFLDTAHKLYLDVIRLCAKIPKKYTFYVSQQIANTATEILVCVKSGNSIYPSNAHEVQMRRDQFIKAGCAIQSLISQLNTASELFPISSNTMCNIMATCNEEINLIKSVIRSDKARYNKMFPAAENNTLNHQASA